MSRGIPLALSFSRKFRATAKALDTMRFHVAAEGARGRQRGTVTADGGLVVLWPGSDDVWPRAKSTDEPDATSDINILVGDHGQSRRQ